MLDLQQMVIKNFNKKKLRPTELKTQNWLEAEAKSTLAFLNSQSKDLCTIKYSLFFYHPVTMHQIR